MTTKIDVLIIGGGVAGLSAALYTSRENFSTAVLLGFGGSAISLTPSIENYPGFETATGNDLIDRLTEQVEQFGGKQIYADAVSLDTSNPNYVLVKDSSNTEWEAKAVFIGTGAASKLLGFEGEKEHYGKGISTCATCDGFFFRQKHVIVVGGGDTAIEDSLFLNQTFNSKVDLLVRGEKFKTNSPEARKLLALSEDPESGLKVHFNTQIVDLKFAENRLSEITTDTGITYKADGLFVAIGRTPATEFLKTSTVPLTDEGYIVVEEGGNRVSGEHNHRIWAAGDVVDSIYSQAITAAGNAVQSAMEIRSFLNREKG